MDSNLRAAERQTVDFLTAFFRPNDTICIRPIEVWTDAESGKKHSSVVWEEIRYRRLGTNDGFHGTLIQTLQDDIDRIGRQHRANIFFGVCPRFKARHYDLAWQIRTVRALWADLDNVSPDTASHRCRESGLPQPSIVVNSGNGVHLYWLLDEPYLIDDAEDDPLPVLTEWREIAGRKKSHKYIEREGEKTFIDAPQDRPQLSEKAQHVQDVMQGIASAIGGDHTHDLARLLRIPGTMNRKNERNGKKPVSCDLVECQSSRRHSVQDFASFAQRAPRHAIAAMDLGPAKRISKSVEQDIADFSNRSSIGVNKSQDRSAADYDICCKLVRARVPIEKAWERLKGTSKFAERGRSYFDLTWTNAEDEAKRKIYEQFNGTQAIATDRCRLDLATNPTPRDVLNYISNGLIQAGNYYTREGQLCEISDGEMTVIVDPEELIARTIQLEDFVVMAGDDKEIELPKKWAKYYLLTPKLLGYLDEIEIFSKSPIYDDNWQLLAPGYHETLKTYFCGPTVPLRDDTAVLDTLLDHFPWRDLADRHNYVALLMVALLSNKFIGAHPLALFTADMVGASKTTLAKILPVLLNLSGQDADDVSTVSYQADDALEKSLGAAIKCGRTVVVIDNAKSQKPIESSVLERSITDSTLCFRELGKSNEIRAKNNVLFCLTANSPQVGPDLVDRSIAVRLKLDRDPPHTWTMPDPIGFASQHRAEIIGELLGMVERWKQAGKPMGPQRHRLAAKSWAPTVGGILGVNGFDKFLSNAGEAKAEYEPDMADFIELCKILDSRIAIIQSQWRPRNLAIEATTHGLFADKLESATSERSLASRMGNILKKFVDRKIILSDEQEKYFRRRRDSDGWVFELVEA